jgi:alkanesulfonate monooxygenase SsuD/methylene tetrahydromethanopterin reductase-like flavin-dependent oxidoreductase (luciferase family)
MAATLDVISGGRLELGIGWGSVPAELQTYGFGPEAPAVRSAKLRESLEILDLMFAGETFDYDGEHFTLQRAIGRPVPAQTRIPVHIGGGGPKLTMPLVERFADWWNCPGYALDRIDELRPLAGGARVSTQHPIGLAPDASTRHDVIATAHRRFGTWGGVIAGTADEVARELAAEANRGVEGFVLQFSDFGTPETIQHFMTEVAPVVRASS